MTLGETDHHGLPRCADGAVDIFSAQPTTMKALTCVLFLLLAQALSAQKNVMDQRCCEPGRWHDARECRGCGAYKGEALLCHGTETNVGYLEIRVPQSFIKLEKVNVSVSIKPMRKGKAARFKVTSIDRNRLGELVTQFGINAQTMDGSKPTEKYVVKYKITGQ